MEFDYETWSITLTSDPGFLQGILGCLMIKTVVPHLDLDCCNGCSENSDLIELTFFPSHFFMQQKSPIAELM